MQHYIEHGKCLSYTCRELRYPSHTLLKECVLEDAPEHADSCCKTGSSMVKLNQQQKEHAVVELCSHTAAAQDIANRYGVAKSTVYKWKQQLLNKGEPDPVTRKNTDPTPSNPLPDNPEELRSEVTRLREETTDHQKQAEELQKQVYRLQLERDVLEKAAETIKKDQGVSLNTLTNREKAIVIDALKDRYPRRDLPGCAQCH